MSGGGGGGDFQQQQPELSFFYSLLLLFCFANVALFPFSLSASTLGFNRFKLLASASKAPELYCGSDEREFSFVDSGSSLGEAQSGDRCCPTTTMMMMATLISFFGGG